MEFAHARKARQRPRPGGLVLAASIAAQGIDHVFTVPGESFLDVLDGLYTLRDRVRLVTCRFEAAAVHMAEAYGKLTARCAAAIVTRGPGACHAAIGVHVAMQDSTPLLLFVGQIPFAETDRESFQEVDYRRLFAPIAKWVTQIDDAARIPELVAHAVDVATSGRPGPVVIALSEEMQRAAVTVPDLPRQDVAAPCPSPEAMRTLRDMLARARKPLAILGGGGWSAAGRESLAHFLAAHDLPAAVAFRRQSMIDNTLPHYAGDLGVGADPALVAKAKEADLILAIGTRLGEAVTQGYTLFDPATAPIVHVHPDAAEIGRVFRVRLGIACHLDRFAEAAAALPPPRIAWSGWTRALRALRDAGREAADYPELNLAQVMRSLAALLDEDAIVTTDAGNFAGWVTRFIDFRAGQSFIGPTNGAMGYSVPAAVGAKIAFPGRMVVACVGDGGFLMTGQEIATAFHHGVAPIVLVFNNEMYGTIRMYQEQRFPGRVSGTTLTNPDFAQLIDAFGGHGAVVTRADEFEHAFRAAAASGRPALIELRMNAEQITSRATITALRAGRGGKPVRAAKRAAVPARPTPPLPPPPRPTKPRPAKPRPAKPPPKR